MTTPQELMAQINAALGTNAVHMASEPKYKVTYIPTGVLPIDMILNGGIPRGRFTAIVGDYSTIKSYIGYKAIKAVQDAGGTAALADTEHAFDQVWAERIGINVKDLIMPPTSTGEEALDAAEALVRAGVDLIVFDSVAAALPQAEQAKRLHKENVQPARLAQLMSTACRKLTSANDHTAIIWTNQTRINLGITFGSNEAYPGGKALPFYASQILRIKKVGKITRDIRSYNGEAWVNTKEQIGQKYQATLEKSKLDRPHQTVWFDWNLSEGQIDLPSFLVAQGVEKGHVTVTGNTWTHDRWKAVGRAKFLTLVTSTPELLSSLQAAVTGVKPARKLRTMRRKR